MRRISKFLAVLLILLVGCTFTIPAQQGTLEAHAASKNYKTLIIGSWDGYWGGDYQRWSFKKNGKLSIQVYNDSKNRWQSGFKGGYTVKGNKIYISSDETYTIKSAKKNTVLKLKYGNRALKLYSTKL